MKKYFIFLASAAMLLAASCAKEEVNDGLVGEKELITVQLNPETKTALGAEDSVDWEYFESTTACINQLRSEGYTLCCLEQVKDSVALQDFAVEKGKKYAIIFGNEVNGVEQAVVDACDVCIEIPQCGTKHSLNVSVSGGIAMWHFFDALHNK